MAGEHSLLGTWKLKSYVVTRTTGERLTPYGEKPSGYLIYSADGRMQAIGTANNRVASSDSTPLDKVRAVLFDTMFAYAGTYSVEDGRVIHHVDVSWNEAWTGTDQVRRFEVHGSSLTLLTQVTDAASSSETQFVVRWDKVHNPSCP